MVCRRFTPWGIDWVSNAVKGGLGVLLFPSVQREIQGLSFARHKENGGPVETMMRALAPTWLNTEMKDASHLSITH